jgi:hypothetical protein
MTHTQPETDLITKLSAGSSADFSQAPTDADRTVRAHVLATLCAQPGVAAALASSGVRITRAIFTGELKLASRTLAFPLEFIGCEFASRIELKETEVKGLKFSGCTLGGVRAERAVVHGSVIFDGGSRGTDELRFWDAQISGSMEFDNAQFVNPSGRVFDGTRIVIDGALLFRNGAAFQGEVRLTDATLKGSMVFDAASFKNDTGPAINAERIEMGSSLKFGTGFRAHGEVRLPEAQISGSVEFEHCRFSNPNAMALRAPGLRVTGGVLLRAGTYTEGEISFRFCNIGATLEGDAAIAENPQGTALSVSGGEIKGGVIFRNGFRCAGELAASGMQTSGSILCDGVTLSNPLGYALRADGMIAKGSATFRNGCTVDGCMRFANSNIGTVVELQNTAIRNATGLTFDAYGMKTGGSLAFRDGVRSTGEIRLSGAQIGGNVEIGRVSFANGHFAVVRADNAVITGGVIWANKARTEGLVRLNFAKIGTVFDLGDSQMHNPAGNCLEAREATIGGSVILSEGFLAEGSLMLTGARIAGALSCSAATIRAPGRTALQAEGMTVGQRVEFNKFRTFGEVRLVDGRIETVLECIESAFINPNGVCLHADRLNTKGRVWIDLGFESAGDVRFVGSRIGTQFELKGGPHESIGLTSFFGTGMKAGASARITGNLRSIWLARAEFGQDLDCTGVVFQGSDQNSLIAPGLRVAGVFYWRSILRVDGYVDLTGARAGELADDGESWPKRGLLFIDNFVYDSLSRDAPVDRREWLQLQSRFNPQTYEQAIKALRQIGRDQDARKLGLAKKRDQRVSAGLSRSMRVWNKFLDLTVGHGYQIGRALIWAGVLVMMGIAFFQLASDLKIMQPDSAEIARQHPLHAAIYSLDVFLPAVDLYQEKYWRPVPVVWWQGIFLAWAWVEILAGWLLTTVALAGLTGLVKKD